MFFVLVNITAFYVLFAFFSIIPSKYARLRSLVYGEKVKDLITLFLTVRSLKRQRKLTGQVSTFGIDTDDLFVNHHYGPRLKGMIIRTDFIFAIRELIKALRVLSHKKNISPSMTHYLISVKFDIDNVIKSCAGGDYVQKMVFNEMESC